MLGLLYGKPGQGQRFSPQTLSLLTGALAVLSIQLAPLTTYLRYLERVAGALEPPFFLSDTNVATLDLLLTRDPMLRSLSFGYLKYLKLHLSREGCAVLCCSMGWILAEAKPGLADLD